jgi:hypothetical protein
MRLFALATLLLIAPVLMGAGAVIYSDKEGEGIEIWTFPSGGSFSKTGEFSDDGAMSLPGGTFGTTSTIQLLDSTSQMLIMSSTRPTIWIKETDGSADENWQIRVDNGELQFQTQLDSGASAT